ncbi:MAG: hypothetical protein M3N13_10575 [Candidatus Eremiobacteraeota bacterium]|nr:hypothetical protein [Candidatus Eremiobacteraeota bacterium]
MAASISFGLGFPLLGTLAVASDAANFGQNGDVREKYCFSGRRAVEAFHLELDARSAKDMQRLANKAEAAATSLDACARNAEAPSSIENDRLRVRAADALFIAAEAHRRIGQVQQRIADLRGVLDLIGDVDSRARVRSNERLYQEAQLLQRYSRHFLVGASV